MSQTQLLALAGSHALILGGAGEIGTAVAAALLRDGCSVTLADVSERQLQTACERLSEIADRCGGQLRTALADGTDEQAVRNATLQAAGPECRLDMAICILGGGPPGINTAKPLVAVDVGDFEKTVNYNVTPTLLLLKSAAEFMIPQGQGAVVAISSVAAVLPAPLMGAYSVGKSALDMLIRLAAAELGTSGIRVNAIRPGYIPDPGHPTTAASPYVASYLAEQPIKRTGTAQDIAAMVRFLSGSESSWITGQCINVDGGLSLHRIPKRDREFLGAAIPDAWSPFLG